MCVTAMPSIHVPNSIKVHVKSTKTIQRFFQNPVLNPLRYRSSGSVSHKCCWMQYRNIFIHKNIVINNKEREVISLTQEELRAALLKRLEREKQCWISKATGINKDTLSRFKRGKIDLYDYLFVKLEAYLKSSES